MPGATGPQSAQAEQAEGAPQPASHSDHSRSSGEPGTAASEAELKAWATLLQQTLATGRQLSELLQLELKLALADGQRLLWVLIAMAPVVMLAWIGLSVLLAWLAFIGTGSVSLGLAGFLLLQLLTLLLLWRAARVFQRSLRLPATRRQFRAITGADNSDGAKTTDT